MSGEYSPQEQEALKQFRLRIPDLISQFDEYDAHDKNLIRWLRARDLNVAKAETMIRLNMKVREENQMDNLQFSHFSELMLEKIPFTPCGYDRGGSVVCIIPFGIWQVPALVQGAHNHEMLMYTAQIFERWFRFQRNHHSVEDFNPQINLLVDFNHFSLQGYMSKQVIGFLIDMLRGYEADYPERLKTAYIVNVPKVFEIFWAMLKPIIPGGTLSKVRILGGGSNQWRKILLENIEARELPSQYGGSNTAHPWYANYLGDIWPARAPSYPFGDFQTELVEAREKFIKSFELSEGDRISWNFTTESYDIGFEFTQDGVGMFPYARADAHICVQDGCVDVREKGQYSLVFDNSYSKYRPKTLHYIIHIQHAQDKSNSK